MQVYMTAAHRALSHIRRTLWHKILVAYYGRQAGVHWWRLIVHDLSKFGPSEFWGYANRLYTKDGPTPIDVEAFKRAWKHHWSTNDHHWEFWLLGTAYYSQMSDQAVREMVADWLAASHAYSGERPKSLEGWSWFQDNFDRIKLHPKTRAQVLEILHGRFFDDAPKIEKPVEDEPFDAFALWRWAARAWS